MKPRIWTSLLIFLSAYAPLALIIVAKDIDYNKWVFIHKIASLCCIGIAIASVFVLCVVMKTLPGQHPVTVISIKSRAGDLINYSIPYLVTFVTVDKFFELSNFIAFALFMALMFVLTLNTQSLFINPISIFITRYTTDVVFSVGIISHKALPSAGLRKRQMPLPPETQHLPKENQAVLLRRLLPVPWKIRHTSRNI